MWVHVVIFMATAGIGIAWKAGWLRLDGFADRESIRLFLIVAVCGNCLGMALTMTSGVREIYTDGYRLEKETTGAYTEEFEVSVDGQDAEKIDVQIPEKESEEGQAAEKTEKRLRSTMKSKRILIIITFQKTGRDRNWNGRNQVIPQEH